MKKTVAALLLATLFITHVGYYFIYTYRQYQIKEEIKERLLTQIPESSLQLIIAEQFGDRIKWEEKNKEFFLDDVLYDVASIKKVNGKIFLYCINDRKEKKLLQDLEKAVDRNNAENKSNTIVKLVLPDLVYITEHGIFSSHLSSLKYFPDDEDEVSSFKKIQLPPPKV